MATKPNNTAKNVFVVDIRKPLVITACGCLLITTLASCAVTVVNAINDKPKSKSKSTKKNTKKSGK